MSGGIAYLYKTQENLEAMVNFEMLEFDEITTNEHEFLFDKIQENIRLTNSTLGKEILADWNVTKHHFVKLIPSEYKKIILATQTKVAEY